MIVWLMRHLARLPLNYPRAVVIVSIFITLVAVCFLPRLYVSTDRNLLAGTESESYRLREEVNEMFGTSLVAVVVITGLEDRAEIRRVADEMAAALSRHPDSIRDVFYKADIGFFEKHALMFLPLDKVKELPGILEHSAAGIEMLGEIDSLPALIEGLTGLIANAPAPEPDGNEEDTAEVLGFFGEVFVEFERWFKDPNVSDLSIVDKIWSAGPAMNSNPGDEGYLTDNDGETPPLAVLFVQPANNSQAMEVVAPMTDLIRQEVAGVLEKHPGYKAEVTGMPAIITDELRTVSRDCVVAGIASGLGVLLVFIIAFRSLRVSMFLVLPLGVGLVWSAGLTALIYGHLTVITSYFAAVLFGLGVAFTIHIVARFHEALLDGKEKAEAVELALTRAGPGVLVGGGTTVLAFLAIVFCDFKGFSEMGVISGLGISLILITNLTLLPAALLLWHPGKKAVKRKSSGAAFWTDISRSRIVVPLVGLVAFIAGILMLPHVKFDYAVENLLPSSADSVVGMRTLDSRTDFSMNYSIALSDTMEGAEELRKKYARLSTVDRAESLGMFVPTGQKDRIDALRTVAQKVRGPIGRTLVGIEKHRAVLGSTTAKSFAESIQILGDELEDMAFDAKKVGRSEAKMLSKLAAKARSAEKVVLASNNDKQALALERTIFSGLKRGLGVLNEALDDQGFVADDLPLAVRGRYQSKDKKHYAVIVFPNGDIGELDFFERHVAELLSVSKETTGHPVTHLEFTQMVQNGFKNAIILAAIAVVLLILLDLRSPLGLTLALVPVVFGLGWTMLLMALTGFKFNYANLMALPILIGTGVDYGVHLAHRAKQEGSIREAARTTGRAIALSGLTTLIGFGSLLLGQHWGVRSLGILLVAGIGFSLFAALIVIPGVVPKRKQ
jgi:uncharacterized protein